MPVSLWGDIFAKTGSASCFCREEEAMRLTERQIVFLRQLREELIVRQPKHIAKNMHSEIRQLVREGLVEFSYGTEFQALQAGLDALKEAEDEASRA